MGCYQWSLCSSPPSNLLCGCHFWGMSAGVGGLHPYIWEGTEPRSTKSPGHSTPSPNLPGLYVLQTGIFFFFFLFKIRAAGFSRQCWEHMPQQVLLYPPRTSSLREEPGHIHLCIPSPMAYHKCMSVNHSSSYHLVSPLPCTKGYVDIISHH